MKTLTAIISTLCVMLATPAAAAWTASGTGVAGAEAISMPRGNMPEASVTADISEISWRASELLPGVSATGYSVLRYNQGEFPEVPVPHCKVEEATSCVAEVPTGEWRFTVVPIYRLWSGSESPPSSPVLVPSEA